jgi:hypothetical protein
MSVLDFQASKDFIADWEAWHKQHEDQLAAPGEWAADDSGVTVDLAPGEEFTLDGARITGRHYFGRIPERGGLFPSDAVGVYEVARRGGNDILRPRHPRLPGRRRRGRYLLSVGRAAGPENTGSQRLVAIAEEGERFDRALWTQTAAVTGGAGNSNALVGTPGTVAQAILDYIDLGVDIISMRGYDRLQDAIDVGQQVIPIVREEVAKRDAALLR